VAAVLKGSWRPQPSPPPDLDTEELARIEPLLLGSGAGALAWWRLRDTPGGPQADVLHDAYRLSCIRGAAHEDDVGQAVSCLRHVGVEPILAKGWAIAQLYAQPGLRPTGDIDLHVPPTQYEHARRAIASDAATRAMNVDVQAHFPDLRDRLWDDLYGRSRLVPLAATDVRVPSPEDHLRLLCRHFLRHGGWRPSWLCDIGAFLEALPPAFDWDLCLQGGHSRAVIWVLALAGALLGANLDAAPAAVQNTEVAPWFPEAVRCRWEIGTAPFFKLTTAEALRRPDWLVSGLRERWLDPVTATGELDGPWNGLPRLPIQATAFTRQIVLWARRAARSRSLLGSV